MVQVARDEFAEATVGASSTEIGHLWQQLFDSHMFQVRAVVDAAGACLSACRGGGEPM